MVKWRFCNSDDYYRQPNVGFPLLQSQHCPICFENEESTPRVLEKVVRYRTLAISCFVLLGAMFAVPATISAVFLPSLKQGLPDPIPIYERVLLEIAAFCGSWKWLLVIPLLGLGLAFTVLASSRVSK